MFYPIDYWIQSRKTESLLKPSESNIYIFDIVITELAVFLNLFKVEEWNMANIFTYIHQHLECGIFNVDVVSMFLL